MIQDKFIPNSWPGIISQPKAEIILKSYGLNSLKKDVYSKIEKENEDEPDGQSRLGNPVFDNIIFKRPEYFIKDSDGVQRQVVLGGNTSIGIDGSQESTTELNFGTNNGGENAFRIDTVLIEVVQQRNVIVTPIAGGNGTVKEYIGEGDYQIKMRGFIDSGTPGKYPKSDIVTFSNYLKAPVPIEIVSNYLRSFNIDKVVILEYLFPQTEGRRNLQFFEITAISEQNLESEFITQ